MVERLRSLGLPGVTARTFHAHALSQLRHFWPSRHDGAPLPQLLDSKIPILGRLGAPAARPLPVHAGQGPGRRDRVGEVAPDRPARVRARGRSRGAGPGAADPGRPVRADLRQLRARQGPPGPHRLRRPAGRDRPPARGGRRRRGHHPGPEALVQRRRIPGHEPAPAAAARAVAGRPDGRLRRRRRRPDDLLVHRRLVRLPDHVRRSPRRRPDPRPDAELPIHAAGPRAREPADRGGRPVEAAVDDRESGPAADDHEVRATPRPRRTGWSPRCAASSRAAWRRPRSRSSSG